MLNYNELKPGTYLVYKGEPYEVLEYEFLRMQQRKPVAQVKMRNLITQNTLSHTFHQGDKIEEAEISRKNVKFIYTQRGEYWFCDQDNPKNRFKLTENQIGKKKIFLKENQIVEANEFNGNVIGITLPIKIDLKVVEAPPSIKGDTAQGGTKQVKLESGATISVPLFINQDDIITINTQSGEYIERKQKAK